MKRPIDLPVRAESPARNHTFWGLGGFCKYVAKYGKADTVVLADPTTGTIRAVLDDKADKGLEVIAFDAQEHPQWLVWKGLLGKTIPVKEFAKFLLTQRSLIVAPKAEQVIQQFAQVRGSKKIEFQTGYGDGSINGVMIEVEIRGQQPQQQPVKLPSEIIIGVPMFIGQDSLEIRIGLILDAKGDCSYIEAYNREIERPPDNPKVMDKTCLCTYMKSYGTWTCGHMVYRLKDTTNQLPDGSFQQLTVAQVFHDYLHGDDQHIKPALMEPHHQPALTTED